MTKTMKEEIKKFPWGQIIKVHEIGNYSIIEYYPHKYVNGSTTGKHPNDVLSGVFKFII